MNTERESWFGEEALLRMRQQEEPGATYAAGFAPEVRTAVARLFARHFLVHLHAELQKPDEILQQDYEDVPGRAATESLLNADARGISGRGG